MKKLITAIAVLLPMVASAAEGTDAPQVNAGVESSIDPGLQKIVEDELGYAFADLRPEKIIAILADPKTGKILAMDTCPNPLAEVDLIERQIVAPGWYLIGLMGEGEPSELKLVRWPVNEALMFNYEPGSTMKTVTCAGFLKARLGCRNIYCEEGALEFAGKTLKDHKPYGYLTPTEVLEKASNIGSAKMALMLGEGKFMDTVASFGFGRRTGLGLSGKLAVPQESAISWGNSPVIEHPDESPGRVLPLAKFNMHTLLRMGIGTQVCVTPIQVLMAYAAIANGGLMVKPTAVRDPKSPMPTPTRILPEDVAATVSKALVVGDLSLARVIGLPVAGKAETGQAITPDGKYAKGQYVTSFVGYFPADDPKVVALVVVDQAKVDENLNYGGLTAAPVFSKIAAKTAAYLHIKAE